MFASGPAPQDQPGAITSLGAGLGKGFGQVMLNAQRYAGKGVRALGGVFAPAPTLSSLVTGNRPSNLVQRAGQWLVDDASQGLQKIEAELAPYSEANPFAAGAGEFGGQVVGTLPVGGLLARGVGSVAPAALTDALATGGMRAARATGLRGMAARVVGGAATGGVSAGLVDPQEAGTGALIGAALPPGLALAGKAASLAGAGVRSAIGHASPAVVALANRAKQLGIDVPADRLVNSKPMDALASGLNYVPFSGRAATEAKMGTQLNRALSRTFGQDSPNVTMALRKAEADLGGKFDTFLRSNTVNLDQQFLTDLADAGNRALRELGSDGASIISKQIDEIVAKGTTGTIDGQAAYNIKKTLDRIGNRNSPEAWYALDLKRKLMDALDRSVGAQKSQGFSLLRQQYGNMLELQQLAKNGVEGEVSVARLANLKGINNPDLQELADIAAQFVKPREGQHGAMQRAVAGGITFGTGGLPGLAAFGAAGRVANTALNSNAARSLAGVPTAAGPNAIQRLLANEDLRLLGYRAAPILGADQ
jgi:hypothetical protein